MLKFRENRRECLPGFSVAEMLLVLLIISFLILAMPPLVHKKVEKRISRGEHGRYECWLDPETESLREFYSTEKDGYTTSDTSAKNYTELDGGKPIGHKVDRCEFNPVEDAPNAAYFAFQATGGGGSGSYAPYDSNNAYYKGESTQTAVLLLNYNPDEEAVDQVTDDQGFPCEHSNGVMTCHYSYTGHLSRHATTRTDPTVEDSSWILDFFTPVHSNSDVVICSSMGYRGEGVYSQGGKEDNGVEGIEANLHCGGEGGAGVCGMKSGNDMWLNASNTIELSGIQDSNHKCNTRQFADLYRSGAESYFKILECGDSHWDEDFFTCGPCSAKSGSNSEYYPAMVSTGCSATTSATDLDGTCTLEQGTTGGDFSKSNVTPASGTDAAFTGECEKAGWIKTSFSGGSQLPSFPDITYTRTLDYNSPSYGYAGDAGESITMILNKLDSELEFEIGKGGERASLSDTAGESGEPTVVKTRVNGATIMTARGGLTVSGGIIGSKIFLRGKYTCGTSSDSDSDSGTYTFNEYEGVERTNVNGVQYISYIDGCLDAGVATYGEAKKRFSVSSGFYTLPELDDDSNTPSAIEAYYTSKYQMRSEDGSIVTYMPGSGGNGGYSFIASTDGKESVTADGHNNFSADILNKQLNNGNTWADNGSNTVVLDYASDSHDLGDSKQFYRCYNNVTDQRYAAESSDGGGSGTADDIDWYPDFDNAEVGFCKPGAGWPGAVIIVW